SSSWIFVIRDMHASRNQLHEPRVSPESVELGLDARPGPGERRLLRDGALQKRQGRLRFATKRMHRRRVVPCERVVGPQPHPAIEALERHAERRVRLAFLAELQVRAAEPRVQLHENTM